MRTRIISIGMGLGGLPALLCGAVVAADAGPRRAIALDGTWSFRLDPHETGERDGWAASPEPFPLRIRVPGAWEAQGIGAPHDKLRAHHEGLAWYRRAVAIPAAWEGGRIFLAVGGVHRAATIWYDGRRVGDHRGYTAPFEIELTGVAKPGREGILAIRVDSRRDPKRDGLVGCQDLIDYVHTSWGGIHRSVRLAYRPPIFLRDVFAIPRVRERAVIARIEIDARGDLDGLTVRASARRRGGDGGPQVRGPAASRMDLRVPAGHLAPWSPEDPALSELRADLLRGGELVDRVTVRFGFREIEIRGSDFFLNGRRLFLRGFGDDSCYPDTLAPPTDRGYYRRVLSIARAYGFNFTRFHSAVPTDEYLDVADELGILVKPELPIAYLSYYSTAPEARTLYVASWEAIIRSRRNHPSIFVWCMGNEHWNGIDLAPELFRIAKTLDPTRPVIDTSGLDRRAVIRDPTSGIRPTLDYLTVYLDEAGSFAWGRERDKNALGGVRPSKPVVGHEFGNFATFPRLERAARFTGAMRPFWFGPWIAKARERGLGREDLDRFVRASERLQALAHKRNIESARLNPEIDGYDLWLLQDYWTVSQGILSAYYDPKGIEPAAFRRWNGPTVLLLDRDRATYWTGETVRGVAYVSRFDDEAPVEGKLEAWIEGAFAFRETFDVPLAGCGRLGPIAKLAIPLPHQIPHPTRAILRLRLCAGSETIENDWPLWIFPRSEPDPGIRVETDLEWVRAIFPRGEGGAIVARRPSEALIERVRGGRRALLLGADGLFRTIPTRFKPAWWSGSARDRNLGLVVRPHGALGDFPHEGWGDLHFYRLVDRRPAFVLEGPLASVRPILQGIDLPRFLKTKAFLQGFRLGRGELLVATVDLGPEAIARPACRHLLRCLVRYLAIGEPDPGSPVLPEAVLARWRRSRPYPEGAVLVEGFDGILEATNPPIEHASARSLRVRSWYARQLDGEQIVRWETTPAPAAERVTFVLLAGMGWRTQPAGGFTLDAGGRVIFRFDVPAAATTAAWEGEVPGARLVFRVLEADREDALGLLFVTLPADLRPPGRPVVLTVRGTKASSRRWFMVHEEPDAIGFWRSGR